MKLPTDYFLKGISEKKVYYFASNRINNDVPHYFICVKKDDNNVLILTCCTSKFDTVRNFIEGRKLPYSTLVHITPNDDKNPFDRDTYINCNATVEYTEDEFKTMYESDKIDFSGEISDVHYEQIIIGLRESPMIDEEIKELLL